MSNLELTVLVGGHRRLAPANPDQTVVLARAEFGGHTLVSRGAQLSVTYQDEAHAVLRHLGTNPTQALNPEDLSWRPLAETAVRLPVRVRVNALAGDSVEAVLGPWRRVAPAPLSEPTQGRPPEDALHIALEAAGPGLKVTITGAHVRSRTVVEDPDWRLLAHLVAAWSDGSFQWTSTVPLVARVPLVTPTGRKREFPSVAARESWQKRQLNGARARLNDLLKEEAGALVKHGHIEIESRTRAAMAYRIVTPLRFAAPSIDPALLVGATR